MAQLVARLTGGQEVAGSSPVAPTIENKSLTRFTNCADLGVFLVSRQNPPFFLLIIVLRIFNPCFQGFDDMRAEEFHAPIEFIGFASTDCCQARKVMPLGDPVGGVADILLPEAGADALNLCPGKEAVAQVFRSPRIRSD